MQTCKHAAQQVSGGRTMRMRTDDPAYLAHVDRWWAVLFAKLRPYLHENGGPILMVQVGACCAEGAWRAPAGAGRWCACAGR